MTFRFKQMDGLQVVSGGITTFLACFALSFLVSSLVVVPRDSSAAEAEAEVNLTVDKIISIEVQDNADDMVASPESSGTLTRGNMVVTTGTNNATGLTLSMAAADNPDASITDTALTHTNGTDKIPTTTNTAYNTLQMNTWGYNVSSKDALSPAQLDVGVGVAPTNDNTQYLRIPEPTTPDTLLATLNPGSAQEVIGIGVNANLSMRAGVYDGLLVFGAVANYVPAIPVQDGDTMQMLADTTAHACPTYPTIAKLVDERDGHYYAVSQLADGRCWMLTNLAYGGTEAGTEFTTGKGSSASTGGVAASSSYWDATNPPFNNQKQWVNPVNSTLNGGGVGATGGSVACATAFRLALTDIDYTECGYFYNWCAALGNASTACDETNPGNVAGAGIGLCPDGWRLPKGGDVGAAESGNGEFRRLANALGGQTSANFMGTSAPWRGVLAGMFIPNTGVYPYGYYGYYWSATAHDSLYSYYVNATPSTINTDTSYGARARAYAVRCILD